MLERKKCLQRDLCIILIAINISNFLVTVKNSITLFKVILNSQCQHLILWINALVVIEDTVIFKAHMEPCRSSFTLILQQGRKELGLELFQILLAEQSVNKLNKSKVKRCLEQIFTKIKIYYTEISLISNKDPKPKRQVQERSVKDN